MNSEGVITCCSHVYSASQVSFRISHYANRYCEVLDAIFDREVATATALAHIEIHIERWTAVAMVDRRARTLRSERKPPITAIAQYALAVVPILAHNFEGVNRKLLLAHELLTTSVLLEDMAKVRQILKEASSFATTLRHAENVMRRVLATIKTIRMARKYRDTHLQSPASRSARALAKLSRARLSKQRRGSKAEKSGASNKLRSAFSPTETRTLQQQEHVEPTTTAPCDETEKQ
ncbi:hypothetical protein MTO96_005095 [Rhipicephalus appendiculatus]